MISGAQFLDLLIIRGKRQNKMQLQMKYCLSELHFVRITKQSFSELYVQLWCYISYSLEILWKFSGNSYFSEAEEGNDGCFNTAIVLPLMFMSKPWIILLGFTLLQFHLTWIFLAYFDLMTPLFGNGVILILITFLDCVCYFHKVRQRLERKKEVAIKVLIFG